MEERKEEGSKEDDGASGRTEGSGTSHFRPDNTPKDDAKLFSTDHFVSAGNTLPGPSPTQGLVSQAITSEIYLRKRPIQLYPHHPSIIPRSQSIRIHLLSIHQKLSAGSNKTTPTTMIYSFFPYPQNIHEILHSLFYAKIKSKNERTQLTSRQIYVMNSQKRPKEKGGKGESGRKRSRRPHLAGKVRGVLEETR